MLAKKMPDLAPCWRPQCNKVGIACFKSSLSSFHFKSAPQGLDQVHVANDRRAALVQDIMRVATSDSWTEVQLQKLIDVVDLCFLQGVLDLLYFGMCCLIRELCPVEVLDAGLMENACAAMTVTHVLLLHNPEALQLAVIGAHVHKVSLPGPGCVVDLPACSVVRTLH